MARTDERGIALITTLLVMALMSALLIGFTAVVMSDQRFRFIDHDRGQSFYGASGGMEKLTADLGNLFFTNIAPTMAQVTALTASTKQPTIDKVTFTGSVAPGVLNISSLVDCGQGSAPYNTYVTETVGTTGYTITYCAAPSTNNPSITGSATPVKSGPYQGLLALQTPYQIDVTAKTPTGGETHLVRAIETVAIPVFQFGMFSDVDLSFFAGPNFSFGGRVHTNGNLFLSQGDGATLTLSDKVTAVKEVIRQRLQNGVSIDTAAAHTGTVNMAQSTGVYRALARTEGSVVDGVGSALNDPTWHNISLSTYNSWIRNGRTGATTLSLPLITAGGSNPDLVKRPVAGEDTSNPLLFGERLFTKASLRILLSDTAADITGLPTVTATAPIPLGEVSGTAPDWKASPPTGYGPVDSTHPPIARSPGSIPTTFKTSGSTSAGASNIVYTGTPPAIMHMPVYPMTITAAVGGATIVVTCNSATATQFVGCVPTANWTAMAINATVSLTVDSVLYKGTLSTAISAASNKNAKTLTFTGLAPFVTNTFWVPNSSSSNLLTLVTCTGVDTQNSQFTGCSNVPSISSGSAFSTSALSSQNTGLIGGYIKAEIQKTDGTWQDVTAELLNYGIAGPSNNGSSACSNGNSTAIIQLQRLKDTAGGCTTQGSLDSYDYWPNTLFDTREGLQRDCGPGGSSACTAAGSMALGGVMYYVAIDAWNLAKWFKATSPYTGGSGANAKTDNGGYTVYFSDRRNNRTSASLETGEYGWEDFVNPASSTGAPNGQLDTGEDVNGNGTLEVYGGVPNYNGTYNTAPPGAASPLTTSATPVTMVTQAQAEVNRSILFRHALKLVDGASIGSTITGLTVVTENPVYIQGNWNASGSFSGTHAATSVMADAVTLLSNGWNDGNSYANPYNPGSRNMGSNSWYRVAIVAGKGMAFSQPSGTATDFGTDGGAHNFLRLLENDDYTVNYTGSIATFYYNRQAVGTYKCCTTVYLAPTRSYAFDTDFQNPALLPPNTPVFRDLNTVGFAQEIRPGR